MAEGIKKRVTTAIVLVAILLAVVLWLPPLATVIALTLVVLAGAWEWSAFLRTPGVLYRALYVAVIGVLMPVAWRLSATPSGRDVVFGIALAWWLIALAWVMFAPRRVSTWSAAAAGVLALVPAWVALLRLRLDLARGAEWVLFALILVWVADIGAFFVGRRFGRTRLAPNVSPGKTWEGVLGGILASALVAVLGSGWFNIPAQRFVPLCLAVVAFSIVGDLTESLLKRFAGVKDSGTLFPGHGGVMDRIDSVTGAAPILFFGLVALGVAA
ncbi:MAG TPA: phosphatidate cytidylyltransferase [Steroidobacteraceae bacterium]|jgi:phosphatidate cytidylyltransferase|nr:phosphatidate cytidylyltransferase [Steroidobacteraceae bacterium]